VRKGLDIFSPHLIPQFEVRQVTDRWYQGEANPEYPVSDYFKVETTGGYTSLNMILKVTGGTYVNENPENTAHRLPLNFIQPEMYRYEKQAFTDTPQPWISDFIVDVIKLFSEAAN